MQNTKLALTLALFAGAGLAAPAMADPAQQPAPVHHTHHHHARAVKRQAAIAPLGAPAAAAGPAVSANAAPMPNESVTAPIDNTDTETTVAPAVMQIHYPPQGDGYTLGSSAQAMDDREAAKVTGVQVKVPLGN